MPNYGSKYILPQSLQRNLYLLFFLHKLCANFLEIGNWEETKDICKKDAFLFLLFLSSFTSLAFHLFLFCFFCSLFYLLFILSFVISFFLTFLSSVLSSNLYPSVHSFFPKCILSLHFIIFFFFLMVSFFSFFLYSFNPFLY